MRGVRCPPTQPGVVVSRRPERSELGLLVEILQDHVDRPEAACVGHARLFDKALYVEDADGHDDHLQARDKAAAICRRCPHVTDCSDSHF